jgi:2-phospho-L-lactate transferase/gluconeogenesis factor (CofD/UPF0052 family)
MNNTDQKIRICIFGGGRGTNTIVKSLLKYSSIEATVVINAYDDGLSTGRLRDFIPGMLGPSDVRKNLTNALEEGSKEDQILAKILEYRFSEKMVQTEMENFLSKFPENFESTSDNNWNLASYSSIRFIQKYLNIFLKYYFDNDKNYNLCDTALGNLVIAGLFIENRNFNLCITLINENLCPKIKIMNATDGENLFLSAITNRMQLISDEASIVNFNSTSETISDIYLLKNKIDDKTFDISDNDKIIEIIQKKNLDPRLNHELGEIIVKADLIIYGPGTPFSSLFPTYLTTGLAEIIANSKSLKIFIGNAQRDSDSLGVDSHELITLFKYFMNLRNKTTYPLHKLVNTFFMSLISVEEEYTIKQFLKDNGDNFDFRIGNWVNDSGKHQGGKILNEINLILNRINMTKSLESVTKISIVMPVLNEVSTIDRAINQIFSLDWLELNLSVELIVIDGGSTDGTLEKLEGNKYIRLFKLNENIGRGAALKMGLNESKGDLVCTFHADMEYRVEDLLKLIKSINQDSADIIFGSRNIKKSHKVNYLKSIYEEKNKIYLLSRYGGILMMLLSGLFYNKWISDPLTGLKIFRREDVKKFKLNQNGLAIETEFIVQAFKSDLSIAEIPVKYFPRSWKEGKKSTLKDGIKSIITLALGRFKL